jgi:hypothetical protein
VDIREQDQRFLGFAWAHQGQTRYFVFTVLPFGLNVAPWLFTKLFKPLLARWGEQGIRVALYLDDGLIVANTRAECARAVDIVRADLRAAGAVEATAKCIWEPTQVICWLGVNIDLRQFSLAITEKRISSALSTITQLLRTRLVAGRERLKVVGKIISMLVVLGPMGQLRTRSLQAWGSNMGLEKRSPLSEEEREELEFWRRNLRAMNSRSLCQCDRVTVRLSSDASDVGLGAVLHEPSELRVSSQRLSAFQRGESSTAREMRAILLAVDSFAENVRGQHVLLQCDNQGAVAICAKGSTVPALQRMAVQLANKCRELQCEFRVVWVPRLLNTAADEASRLEDWDNWGIQPNIFAICQARWGVFTVDRFADHENALCTRFNSKSHVPRTEAVDCFTQSWSDDFNWVVPPLHCASRAILFMLATRSYGVLGVPEWPGAPFFPLLRGPSGSWLPFVADVWRLPVGTKLFRPDRDPASAFAQPYANFPFIFLRISPA